MAGECGNLANFEKCHFMQESRSDNIFLSRSKGQKSVYFHLAAMCKNILELCVVEVSQPGGMNLEFAVCLVDEEKQCRCRRLQQGMGQSSATGKTYLTVLTWSCLGNPYGSMEWGYDK